MPKVMVIGLDGVTFKLLAPWMDAGKLPHLRKIRDHGVSGDLESSIPPVTAPAWQCFMSGKNPGKHGVHFFQVRKPGSYEQVPVFAARFNESTLWELLSEEGYRVLVLNVPFTFPPRSVNGVLISGFTTPPSKSKDCCFPPQLLAEIEARFGDYPLQLRTPPLLLINQVEGSVETLIGDCKAMTDYHFQVAQFLMKRDEYDFVMFYLLTTDRIQHWLWHVLDGGHSKHPSNKDAKTYKMVLEYYQELDEQIGRMVESAGGDCHTIVLSDHGFGPVRKAIDLNVWLLHEGYIQLKSTLACRLKFACWRRGWSPVFLARTLARNLLKFQLVRRQITRIMGLKFKLNARSRVEKQVNALFLSKNDIDWSRTKAYCCNAYGQISINLAGREPEGCVKPGEEYEALRDEIAAKLRALRDPETGEPVNGQVLLSQDVYWGSYAHDLPEITFLSLENGYTAGHLLGFADNKVFSPDAGAPGGHRMAGILMARGPSFKRGNTIAGANLIDLAPTILYLMGSKVPRDMDGRVLEQIFDEAFLKTYPIEYSDAGPESSHQAFEMSKDDQAEVLDRLKGLGYID